MRFEVPLALFLLLPIGLFGLLALRRAPAHEGRALTLILIALALAQPELALRRERETVYLLVDRSESVDEAAQVGVDQALSLLSGQVDVGVIEFACEAQVVRLPAPLPLGELPPAPLSPWGTDIAAAVDLALALLPEGPARLILISDGRDTQGDPLGAMVRARERGVPVYALPVGQKDGVWVASFEAPERVPEGGLELEVVAAAAKSTDARILLIRDGEEVHVEDLSLSPGLTHVRLFDLPPGAGVHEYTVLIEAEDDPILENNLLHRAVVVGDSPPVLLVGGEPSALDDWFSAAGLGIRRVPTLSPAELGEARLVMLDNYPLFGLSPTTLAALRGFVAGGGGLLAVLGRRAVERYVGAAEELLPVSFSVPQGMQEATVAIVFVLDRSASMAGRSGTMRKIDLLKEAVAQAVEVMRPEDLVAAVAFDRYPHWLTRPGPVKDTEESLYLALRALTPSGGTDLYPAVEEALASLEGVEARLRHILLVSDGRTVREGRDFSLLYRKVKDSGVGLTAIAVGEAPDTEVLSGLAQAAGGELLLLPDVGELPRVLIQETERVVRPRFVEDKIDVHLGPAAPALGLAGLSLPPLFGYTLTFPKPTAEVALVSGQADPILALWQLGLGRVAVLTTDLSGGWSRAWLTSPELSQLLSRLVEALWPKCEPVQASWEEEAGGIVVTVDVAAGGRWVNGISLSGELLGAGGRWRLDFRQVGPGRYRGRAPLPPAGAYLLVLSEPEGRYGGTFPLSLPYPAELASFGPDYEALARLGKLTGGGLVTDELLPEPPGTGRRWLPLARPLLWAAGCAFLLDLLLRKFLA